MDPSTIASALARQREELLGAIARTARPWVVGQMRVKPGAARRLLDLQATDETVYFVSGRGSGGTSTLEKSESTFVGVGSVKSRRFEGTSRLVDASHFIRSTFEEVEIPPELATLVRFFGGASFSPGRDGGGNCWSEFGDARFLLPRVIYVDDESRPEEPAQLVCLTSREEIDVTLSLCERVLEEIEKGESHRPPSARPSTLWREESEEPAEWKRLVEGIKSEINHGQVQKVVAARRVTLKLSVAPRAADVLSRLNENAPLCARFCLRIGKKTFIGATPERLIARSGKSITTEALAGSISASEANAAATLYQSEKDRREHAYVVSAIKEALSPLCEEFRAPDEPEVRRLQSIFHLRTPIAGRLHGPVHILELVERLHPTPAVGGMPRARAVDFITTHEHAERGWYAAPVGWVDAAGNGEFVVALRSGLIAGDKVHVYAGAGIVEGSDSSAEYAETELKLAGMLGALGVLSLADPGAPQSKQVRDECAHP